MFTDFTVIQSHQKWLNAARYARRKWDSWKFCDKTSKKFHYLASQTCKALVSSLHSKIQTSNGRSKINYQIVMSRLKLLFRACKAWVQSAATGGSPDCDERVHAMRLHTHCTFNVTFPFGMGSSTTATETARRRSFYDVGVDKVRVVDNPTKLLSRHSVYSGKVRENGHSNQTDE